MYELPNLDRIDQLDAMRMGVDYRSRIRIRNFEVTVRPLAISETVRVAAEVSREMGNVPQHMRNKITEEVLLAKETLKLASTPDVGSPIIGLTDAILERMTNDELLYAMKQYNAACDRVSPLFERMSAEEVEALVREVKKKAEAQDVVYLLTELSLSQLVSMVSHLLTKDD